MPSIRACAVPAGTIDPRFESKERCHVRDGAAVIAVGRGRQRQWARAARRRRRVRRSSATVRAIGRDACLKRSINRPRCAENLERRKPEATRFVFYQHLPDTEQARELGNIDQRVAGSRGDGDETRAARAPSI